ncbi:MAG: DMT family transporter [Candidatus Kerfeldbacteria bacterium]
MANIQTKKEQPLGVTMVLLNAVLWGMFPVVVNFGAKEIAPITFAALSALCAGAGFIVYAAVTRSFHELKDRRAYVPLLAGTLFVIVVPYTLFYTGTSMTSGVNSSMLLLAEIIFTLVFTHFIGEKTTRLKVLGAGGVLFGSLFILYNGSFSLNLGDLLIIASTVTYPIGNFYGKRALNYVSPATILFMRYTLGGLFISALALLFEPHAEWGSIVTEYWWIILVTGLLLFGVTKVIWYEGLKRLDISKAISLGMTFPVFSLVALLLFFNETISLYQWIGIIIMLSGVYFSIRRPSVDLRKTRYAE